MSLSSDLQKNLEVFKRITGLEAESGDDAYSPEAPVDLTVKGASDGYSPTPFAIQESINPPVQSFSLSYGTKTLPQGSRGFDTVSGIKHPELNERRESPSPEPLEAFYHSLDLSARMVSQLLREEDFLE